MGICHRSIEKKFTIFTVKKTFEKNI